MFLMIQNAGVAAVQAFTVLGLSTARGDASKIGQFGSGSKHSINILLRNKLSPLIYLGERLLSFYTEKASMGEKEYEHVFYSFDGLKVPTGFALEFGELDWNSVEMALREFISNAIDQVGHENVILDIVEEVKPFSDHTTIYVPVNDEIKRYYNNISDKFLHFSNKHELTILERPELAYARIYRKGVFVRQIESATQSLFDYNFGESFKIDESRNMDNYSCLSAAGDVLRHNKEALKKYINSLTEVRSELWEDNMYTWFIGASSINTAWTELFGEKVACRNHKVLEFVRKNGHEGVVIHNNYKLLVDAGVPDGDKLQGAAAERGVMECKVPAIMTRTYNKVWNKLQATGFTQNKTQPPLKAFSKPMTKEGESLMGFYDPPSGTVFINVDYAANTSTHLEELAHYITGAGDNERALQDFAFSTAARWGFR